MLFPPSGSSSPILSRKRSQISDEMFHASIRVGRLIKDYAFMQSGDQLLVVLDGFQESFCLLDLLVYRRSFAPIKYGIKAVLLENAVPSGLRSFFENFCQTHGVPFAILPKTTFSDEEIVELLNQAQCNKLAQSFTFNDFNEMILEDMFFKGSLSRAPIQQDLSQPGLSRISPLGYVDRDLISRMALKEYPKVAHLLLPRGLDVKRQAIRDLLNNLLVECDAIEKNLFNSFKQIKTDYLL